MLDTTRKLFAILPPGDKGKLLGLLLLMLVGSALEVLGVGMIPAFVAVLQQPERVFGIDWLNPVWGVTGISTAREILIWGSFFLVALFVVKNIYVIGLNYIQSRYVYGRFGLLATQLFKAYMRAPYTFHLQRNTAELIRNVTNETREVTYNVLRGLLRIVMETVVMLGIFVLLVRVEPLITLFTMLVLGGLGGLFLGVIKKRLRNHGERAVKERGRIIQAVNEGIGGFKETTILNRQDWFVAQFREFVDPLVDALTFRQVTNKASKPAIETIAVGGLVFIALLLLLQGRTVQDLIPILTLFGVATVRLMPAFRSFVGEFNNVRFNAYVVDPIYQDLRRLAEADTTKPLGESSRLSLTDHIRLTEVSYAYPEAEKDAVKDISLRIPSGQALGLVGPSGAGKTTLVDLVLGLLKPSSGTIKVDGHDIQNALASWQRNIGYVPQSIYLADTTIRRNIAFGISEEKIDDDALWQAICSAQVEDFVRDLPNGVDTRTGEQGMQFSGGQRQRIGIARALYHQPQVLILDEATSSLDNNTEKYVLEAIEALKGDRTILMIAHRMSSVTRCDQIGVLGDGKLVRVGEFDDLLDSSPEFKKLNLKE